MGRNVRHLRSQVYRGQSPWSALQEATGIQNIQQRRANADSSRRLICRYWNATGICLTGMKIDGQAVDSTDLMMATQVATTKRYCGALLALRCDDALGGQGTWLGFPSAVSRAEASRSGNANHAFASPKKTGSVKRAEEATLTCIPRTSAAVPDKLTHPSMQSGRGRRHIEPQRKWSQS